jgi:hypothetical protein
MSFENMLNNPPNMFLPFGFRCLRFA